MKTIVAVTALLASAGGALASGSLDCSAEDKAVKFELAAGLTHGMGAPAFDFHGTLDIRDESVAGDMRKLDFGAGNLPQYWLDAQELRLLVYTDRPAGTLFGSVELEIKTLSLGDENEGHFEGGYKLTVHDLGESGTSGGKTSTFTGKVSCFAE